MTVDSKYSSTFCLTCGTELISRKGYTVKKPGLDKNRCRKCATPSPVITG